MSSEQSCKFTLSIKSEVLGEILRKHKDLIKSIDGNIVVSYNSLSIDSLEECYFTNIPQKQEHVVGALVSFFKQILGKDSKEMIKEIKKAKKTITKEAISDWYYIETAIGELAKEMSQIERDKPNLEEAERVEKYIWEFSFKNGEYLHKEYPIFKEN